MAVTTDPSPAKTPRHVLIVDDSETARLSFQRYLQCDERHAYVFSEAETVAEALRQLELETPDCILLDYVLPGKSGLKLLETIQERPEDECLAVILITGHDNRSLAVEAMKGGASDYLAKLELTADTLCHAVDGAIEKSEMRRQLSLQRRQLEDRNRELLSSRRRLKKQNERLLANQRALLNMRDDLEAEVVRRRASEVFRLAFESAPLALLLVDAQGSIVNVNAQLEANFGYASDELIGQAVEVLLPELLREGHARQRQSFLASPEPRVLGSERHLTGRTKEGREISLEIGISLAPSKTGPLVVVGIIPRGERPGQ